MNERKDERMNGLIERKMVRVKVGEIGGIEKLKMLSKAECKRLEQKSSQTLIDWLSLLSEGREAA